MYKLYLADNAQAPAPQSQLQVSNTSVLLRSCCNQMHFHLVKKMMIHGFAESRQTSELAQWHIENPRLPQVLSTLAALSFYTSLHRFGELVSGVSMG